MHVCMDACMHSESKLLGSVHVIPTQQIATGCTRAGVHIGVKLAAYYIESMPRTKTDTIHSHFKRSSSS